MQTNEVLDPPIDEVREARRRISARFGHDAQKLIEHYMELQKRHRDRLVFREREAPVETTGEVVD